jgi:hypothetical protein
MPTQPATHLGRWLDAVARGIHAAWAWCWFVGLAPFAGLRQALAVRRELAAYASLDAAQLALLQHVQLVFYRLEEASANRRLLELDSRAAHQAADEALLAYYRAVIAMERRDLADVGGDMPPTRRLESAASGAETR